MHNNLDLTVKKIEQATAQILAEDGYDSEYIKQFIFELMVKLYNIEYIISVQQPQLRAN